MLCLGANPRVLGIENEVKGGSLPIRRHEAFEFFEPWKTKVR